MDRESNIHNKKRGIYLVANLKSQDMCENLIYSIRSTGCTLPIRVIHFGGEKITSKNILNQVEFLEKESFSQEALAFVNALGTILDCPRGFLHRFLGFFSDWDEFIYSDNDIVATSNWEKFFSYFPEYDLVHADEEYITEGKYNYDLPLEIERIFGEGTLTTAITAGHFAIKINSKMIDDYKKAIEWFQQNPSIPKKHDQALLHIASLLGKWKVLNLCKTQNWLSSWAGDYKNTLALIHALQAGSERANISHIHYSGFSPEGRNGIEELLYAYLPDKERLSRMTGSGIKNISGFNYLKSQKKRIVRKLKSFSNKK